MMNMLMMAAALAAPALGSATATATCGKDLRGLAIQGQLLDSSTKPDRKWCRKACEQKRGCEGSTFMRDTRKCFLYKLDGDSMFHEEAKATSFVPCGKCDQVEKNVDFHGEEIMGMQTKDVWWCRKECMENSECNATTFRHSGRWCQLKKVLPEFKRSRKHGVSSYLHCDAYNVLPVCARGDIVADGVCDSPEQECGKRNQRICYDGEACEEGLTVNSDAECVCGGKWETCCEGACGDGLECVKSGNGHGQCAPCGGDATNDYQVCCGGDTCSQDGKRRVCLPGKGQRSCSPCGGLFQPVCGEEPVCDGMTIPDPQASKHNAQCIKASHY